MKNDLNNKNIETAVFGGGCFWCLEAIFARLKGIEKTTPGYAGGNLPSGEENPTYEEVCSGRTGHAKVVKIEYNPKSISYEDLLTVFFAMHDPTTLNRQGSDTGTQYRSIILFENDEQRKTAETFLNKLGAEKIFEKPIVTELAPLSKFFPAEVYHRRYFAENPYKPYCQLTIFPKIEKLRKKFKELVK